MFKKVIWQGLLVGVINFVANMLIGQIFKVLFPGVAAEYLNPNLFRPYSSPLMLLFFVHPFLLGILLAWFWQKTKNIFSQDTKGGVKFGFFYWIISTIPGMFATYTSMPYSFAIVLSWTVAGLAEALIAGVLFAKLNKNKI